MFNFLAKRKLTNAFESNNRKHSFQSLDSMNTVMILFNYKDWDEISVIEKDLKRLKKEVLLWTVEPQIKSGQTLIKRYLRIIPLKSMSKISGLSSEITDEFKNLSYDTLFDFTAVEEDALLYLLGINTSQFCVGIRKIEYKAFDFVMLKGEEKSIWDTYEEIKNYMSNIKV